MADFGKKLGRKKEEAIVALLSQRSIEDAPGLAKLRPGRYIGG
jgi:hypothetical protein